MYIARTPRSTVNAYAARRLRCFALKTRREGATTPAPPQALRLAFTTVLRRKGRVLDAMTDSLATVRRRMSLEDQQLLAQWAAARGQLATLVIVNK